MGRERDIIGTIRAELEPHGIFLRGAVQFEDADGPKMPSGVRAKAVILLGNVGGSMWPDFRTWHLSEGQGIADPLDAWSMAFIRPVAEMLGGQAFFPSEKPWRPFQQWAMLAEGLRPSPLGILIHPEYGLWHGYRGAIGFEEDLEFPQTERGIHPCDICLDKPCLSTCPVEAIAPRAFDVVSCRAHLRSKAGQQGCMQSGCIARNACPVGADYRYPEGQLRFHMDALV